jgi:hypothetical protein
VKKWKIIIPVVVVILTVVSIILIGGYYPGAPPTSQHPYTTRETFEYNYIGNFTITLQPGDYSGIYALENFCNNTVQVQNAVSAWINDTLVSHKLTSYIAGTSSIADLIFVSVKTTPATQIHMYLYHGSIMPNEAEHYKVIDGADRFTFSWLAAFGFANLSNEPVTVSVTVNGVGEAYYQFRGS